MFNISEAEKLKRFLNEEFNFDKAAVELIKSATTVFDSDYNGYSLSGVHDGVIIDNNGVKIWLSIGDDCLEWQSNVSNHLIAPALDFLYNKLDNRQYKNRVKIIYNSLCWEPCPKCAEGE